MQGLRDITQKEMSSIFEQPFFALLKEANSKYGMKVQLNLFYRTDSSYNDGDFCLKEVPDTYKAEWIENSKWLKLAFHAHQEFPDYPYVNSTYDEVNRDFNLVKNEVIRFAGEETFAKGVIPHWMPMSKSGVTALYDGGIKVMHATYGDRYDYCAEKSTLHSSHVERMLLNCCEETALYCNVAGNDAISGYNHISAEKASEIRHTLRSVLDNDTGMYFRDFGEVFCLNRMELDEVDGIFAPLLGNEYIGFTNHEQYFYPYYFAYQSDYAEKMLKAVKLLCDNGYEFVFAEDLV